MVWENGFSTAVAIALGIVVGLWLDDRFHTRPLFFLIGVLLGFLVAGYNLYRLRLLIANSNRNGRE